VHVPAGVLGAGWFSQSCTIVSQNQCQASSSFNVNNFSAKFYEYSLDKSNIHKNNESLKGKMKMLKIMKMSYKIKLLDTN
jgi:hypothetical protein